MAGERIRVRVAGYGDVVVECQGNLGGIGWTASSDAVMPTATTVAWYDVEILDGALGGQTARANVEMAGGRLTLVGISGFRW